MLTVAYLANEYPAAVEPYVGEEVRELRRRGIQVLPSSVRRIGAAQPASAADSADEVLFLQPLRLWILLTALQLAVRRWAAIADLVTRVLLRGNESVGRRVKALMHTWLGAYYAVLLQDRGIDHIHVHHGYFASWIAMVAARLLGIEFSLTLHGSDLLLDGAYLDTKLEDCRCCYTISEYNRRFILEHFPLSNGKASHATEIDPNKIGAKIIVSRLGVDIAGRVDFPRKELRSPNPTLRLLSIGRLHAVKDHAFLVRACARLRDGGLSFQCAIAGEGPERNRLELMIRENRLQDRVMLLGHVARERMDSQYRSADVVVLTSRSEGIPLVLMEAMAQGRIVLAPAITGIPELVIPGKTGFSYLPGVLEDFVDRILLLERLTSEDHCCVFSQLDWMRHAARTQIRNNFNRSKNLSIFSHRFLQLIDPNSEDAI